MHRRKMLNKKAVTQVQLFIIQLILVGSLFIFFLAMIRSYHRDTLLEQHSLSNDIALMINAIVAAPGNVIVLYSNPLLENFSTMFRKKAVEVKPSDGMPIKKEFSIPKNIQAHFGSIARQKIFDIALTNFNLDVQRPYLRKRNIYSLKYVDIPFEEYVKRQNITIVAMDEDARLAVASAISALKEWSFFKGGISDRADTGYIFISISTHQKSSAIASIPPQNIAHNRKLAALILNSISARKLPLDIAIVRRIPKGKFDIEFTIPKELSSAFGQAVIDGLKQFFEHNE